jgi:hypothetical protein
MQLSRLKAGRLQDSWDAFKLDDFISSFPWMHQWRLELLPLLVLASELCFAALWR